MYFVYIIECENGSFYTGSSPDPTKRFKQHRIGDGSKYTRMHRPVRIVYVERCDNKSLALKREMQIKGWSRTKKENLIRFGRP